MSKFKVGSLAKVIDKSSLGCYGVCNGDIVVIKDIFETRATVFNSKYGETSNGKNLVSMRIEALEPYSDYESSNRYKLKQAIKETGISSRKLSHFAVGNESFFYNQTGPARFKEYGDISSSKLDSMLVLIEVAKINLNAKIEQDAFDEREKLDLSAKIVDENNVPIIESTKPYYWEKEIGNSDKEDYSRYVDQLQSQAIEKRDYRLRKWLIAFLILVIIIAVYFLNH